MPRSSPPPSSASSASEGTQPPATGAGRPAAPTYREREEPTEAVDALVEELLRYLSVVQVAFPRFVRRDTEVAGVRMRRGDLVLCSLSRANRDYRSARSPSSTGWTPCRCC